MIGVLGAGAWGTALAQMVASDGTPVTLWAREADVVAAINSAHENTVFLPGRALSERVRATASLAELADCDLLLVVVPAQHVRSVLAHAPVGATPLVLCSKGLEAGTDSTVAEVAAAVAPSAPVAVLSGPTFASEVAAGLPTALTLACEDEGLGARLADRLARPGFRPYLTTDMVGAEIGGAVKNVLAIACGVVEGAGLGLNARAALIARGFAEMTRYGLARGARAETLGGLSGLGDLVLTCSSVASRNFSLGVGLGQGRTAVVLLSDRRTVAEGATTAPVLSRSAAARGVEMPITDAVAALLAGEVDASGAIEALLARPLRVEGE